jgi:PD-(D/E)XK nuclease superfamily
VAVPVWFRGQKVGDFRADLLVDGKVIVELKTGREVDSAWESSF